MPQVTFDEIAGFVATAVPHRKDGIVPGTTLAKDLGLDGDDAVEFFEVFQKRFTVDLSGIRWGRHFGPEAPFMPWLLLWPPWWKWRKRIMEVSVADLLASANAGRWVFPYETKA